MEQYSNDCLKTKTKVITLEIKNKDNQVNHQNSKQIHVAGTKCGKACASEAQLVLVLFLIG